MILVYRLLELNCKNGRMQILKAVLEVKKQSNLPNFNNLGRAFRGPSGIFQNDYMLLQ